MAANGFIDPRRTRTGKIARLPRAVREALNRRLRDGEEGRALLAWLNDLPEAKALLAADFGGRFISAQNLSEWKQGGYHEWLMHQDAVEQARELAANSGELTAVAGVLTEHLTTVVAARYASVMAQWDGDMDSAAGRLLRGLRLLCQDVVELRRGDHSAARLKIEGERLALERRKFGDHMIAEFEKWVQQPEIKESICGKGMCSEERMKLLMRLMFGDNAMAAEEEGLTGQSDLIKPNQTFPPEDSTPPEEENTDE